MNIDESRTSAAEFGESAAAPADAASPQQGRRQWLKVASLCAVIAALMVWNVRHGRNIWSAEADRPPGILSSDDVKAAQLGSGDRGAATRASFDLSNATVPTNEIRSGGPAKDGIPALTNPQFVDAGAADYLAPDDRVIGVVRDQDARAYPLKILNYHEVVNDRVADVPIAITFCPLCDSAAVFDRRSELGEREFGVSGLLYNSNVLMYDRTSEAESLWSQMKMAGVSGPGAEQKLQTLPLELTTWRDWKSRYPNTKVLSDQTGHTRDYQRDPYGYYFSRPGLMFPAQPASDRLPEKSRVLGVWTDTAWRAYPVEAFTSERLRVEDRLDGKRIVIEFNPAAGSLRVVEADEGIQWVYSLWFAWYAFHPDTDVFGDAID